MPSSINKFSFTSFIALFIIGIIPILYTEDTFDPNEHLQFLVLTISLLVFWGVQMIQKTRFELNSVWLKLFLGTYLVFLIYSVYSISIALNFADAIFMFMKYSIFFFLTVSIIFLQQKEDIFKLIVCTLSILSIVICVPAVYQFLTLIEQKDLVIPKSTYLIPSIFAHRNLFVEFLVLSLPFSIYSIFTLEKFWEYIGYVSVSLSIFFIILLSNRTSWLCLIFILLFVFILSIMDKKRHFTFKKSVLFFTNVLLVSALSIFVLISYSNNSSLKQHTLQSLDTNQGSTKDRVQLWERTLKLIKEKPLFGHGLDAWQIHILKYGNEGLASEDNITFYQRPHNDFLWVFADQGIVGLILYVSLFMLVLLVCFKLFFSTSDDVPKSQVFVVVSVILVYLLISLFSFPKERISHSIILFTAIGLGLYWINKGKGNNTFAINFAMLLFLLPLAYIGLEIYNSDKHIKQAITRKFDSDFVGCLEEIELGKSPFYTIDETSTPIEWHKGICHFNLGNNTQALNSFENALKQNPYHIYLLNDYASCLSVAGNNKEAEKQYRKSISLSSNFLDAKLNLCALLVKEKSFFEAFEILKTINTKEKSTRYQKTVRVLFVELLNAELKANNPNAIQFKKELMNHRDITAFYIDKLQLAIEKNLTFKQLISHTKTKKS